MRPPYGSRLCRVAVTGLAVRCVILMAATSMLPPASLRKLRSAGFSLAAARVLRACGSLRATGSHLLICLRSALAFFSGCPCVVPLHYVALVLKIYQCPAFRSTHSQSSVLVPHTFSLPPLLHTQAARQACLPGCVPFRYATFHASASQPFGGRRLYLHTTISFLPGNIHLY